MLHGPVGHEDADGVPVHGALRAVVIVLGVRPLRAVHNLCELLPVARAHRDDDDVAVLTRDVAVGLSGKDVGASVEHILQVFTLGDWMVVKGRDCLQFGELDARAGHSRPCAVATAGVGIERGKRSYDADCAGHERWNGCTCGHERRLIGEVIGRVRRAGGCPRHAAESPCC